MGDHKGALLKRLVAAVMYEHQVRDVSSKVDKEASMANSERDTNERLIKLGRAFLEARFKNPAKQTSSADELFKGGQGSKTAPDPSGSLSRSEALEILDLKEGATENEIRSAYIRLIQQVHPDKGGSTFFAKQLNAARKILLG